MRAHSKLSVPCDVSCNLDSSRIGAVCERECSVRCVLRNQLVPEDINANLDVEGLCNNLLERVAGVIESEGGRVKW